MASPIEKKILHAGNKVAHFNPGTKVKFHFQTRKNDKDQTLIEDSKKLRNGDPMTLVLGMKFKLEVWEVIVQNMALNEVSQFVVHKNLVQQYPFVSKTLRDLTKPACERHSSHCCAGTLQTEGLGYDDLNEMLKNPTDLVFIIELVSVQQPDEYEKEEWQLNDSERLSQVPKLREKGNEMFKSRDYSSARNYYNEGLAYLDQLMLKEKPGDTEWNQLLLMKIPLLLNFAQCQLNLSEFYPAIEMCNEVLKHQPDNVKALYRRAKAHMGAWNVTEAKNDFHAVLGLDESLKSIVEKDLKQLERLVHERDRQDKDMFKNIL